MIDDRYIHEQLRQATSILVTCHSDSKGIQIPLEWQYTIFPNKLIRVVLYYIYI